MLRICPNPFRSSALITYGLAKPADVSLKIYNIAGQCVRILVKGKQNAGAYNINWRGNDDHGRKLSEGIYFVRMATGNHTETFKVVMVR